MIRTVLGDISPQELQFCQPHEHVFVRRGRPWEIDPALLADEYPKSLTELLLYRAAGGVSLLDAQPGGCGRMEEELICASRESSVHIIAVTGFHRMDFYPAEHPVRTQDPSELADVWRDEVLLGMRNDAGQRTAARAGVVKCAVPGGQLTGRALLLVQAAARAAAASGAALLCHTDRLPDAAGVLNTCAGEGLPMERVILCHLDRTDPRPELHRELAQAGAYLEFDTVARYKYHGDNAEISLISRLIDGGYERKLLLSLDTTAKRMRSYGGEIGLDHILRVFLPLMEKSGIGERAIRRITVENPAVALDRKERSNG